MADIEIARRGAVLELTINRPAKKNALTNAMYRALNVALHEAERDLDIAAVLVAGAGGVFCAGNDIGDFVAAVSAGGEMAGADFIRKIAAFPKPLVAAVDGLAVGVGCTLLLHCDLIYATPESRFSLPFIDLGLLPEAGSSLLLPRRVGMARASAWLLAGESFSAAEALAAGLVNDIVAQDSLLATAREKAAKLAAKPRTALMAARKFLRGDKEEILTRIDAELEAFRNALASPQAQAALAAFLNKSK
ncbi:enoyl-CoA hydratase/isomerase family protein [Rhodoblastus acidophilus]|uniref:Enoyl-CoA hydratase/isomerase family protein n=1 Tax=Candidatus Rhodoblastus alkanivorans TaxID=2954117 RepID=A0ABS9Z4R4_9HYPH|nr:enoyl-CoA hydratase-related protein [Candidatus Rhodoblastus alkanivorans]MCI4677681.1 enoyl-CoA hydratase/isomerase family protein [Candidatus Rhodoblastus alkanivorans]MCI4682587.1 enoyl-CoA hydratase/isomerase family protein [Candidatus Rhodoblastus alkanivorans]MDI4639893.1 enoyl-CoA hydratase/isomerase family protein [Rhodoblastus acidophilus]